MKRDGSPTSSHRARSDRLRLVLAQVNHTIGDFDGLERIVADAITSEVGRQADAVVLPEMATTGYPPRDLLDHERFIDANIALLDRLVSMTSERGPALIVGYVARNEGVGKPLHNAVALLSGGRILASRAKSLLPTYDVFDEARYFEPAETNTPVSFRGWRLGLTICEDLWYEATRGSGPMPLYGHDPVQDLVELGAEVIINVSASPFTLGKGHARRGLVARQAERWRTPIVYVNQVGGHDELIFDGHSKAVDCDGHIVANARDFAEQMLPVTVVAATKASGDRDDTAGAEPKPCRLEGETHPVSSSIEEEAYRALVLGLRDYVARCGFERVVLGLSGGIDSALTAVVAASALGAGNVLGVAMPSRYSSEGSVRDARDLAANLGIGFEEIAIEPMFEAFLTTLAPVFGDRPADVTEENLQARIRGVILMALSNKLGNLLLTTGNKSELAVGYCTLYGDMCGGLAVISDLPKTLVYRVARWINRDGEVIPESTLTKPPSAELKEDQRDQDTLPAYEILDAIIEGYVEERRSLEAIVSTVSTLSSGDNKIEAGLVERWVRAINRNEYKRRQAAPGLRVTSKAFGIGRRMPIAAAYHVAERVTTVDDEE